MAGSGAAQCHLEWCCLAAHARRAALRRSASTHFSSTCTDLPPVYTASHPPHPPFLPVSSLSAADVLTIENSRSGNEMVAALAGSGYGRDVGPGVYDVHSPVVPSVDFLVGKIRSFMQARAGQGKRQKEMRRIRRLPPLLSSLPVLAAVLAPAAAGGHLGGLT